MRSCESGGCTEARQWWRRRVSDGATLDGHWFCSRGCIERELLARLIGVEPVTALAPRRPSLKLGVLLRQHGACRPELIDEALAAQGESRLRLGEQLRSMGAVEAQAVLHALAAQAGVSYLTAVDVSSVREAPGGLALDAIQALGILPIGQPDNGRIRVAFPAPVPRAALIAFRQQSGWTPEPFLVSDDDWLLLLENYGTTIPAGLSSPIVLTRAVDVADAARGIAETALTAKAATLQEARWGVYVWVRVRGGGVVSDVLFEHADHERHDKEGTWPVATTSR